MKFVRPMIAACALALGACASSTGPERHVSAAMDAGLVLRGIVVTLNDANKSLAMADVDSRQAHRCCIAACRICLLRGHWHARSACGRGDLSGLDRCTTTRNTPRFPLLRVTRRYADPVALLRYRVRGASPIPTSCSAAQIFWTWVPTWDATAIHGAGRWYHQPARWRHRAVAGNHRDQWPAFPAARAITRLSGAQRGNRKPDRDGTLRSGRGPGSARLGSGSKRPRKVARLCCTWPKAVHAGWPMNFVPSRPAGC